MHSLLTARDVLILKRLFDLLDIRGRLFLFIRLSVSYPKAARFLRRLWYSQLSTTSSAFMLSQATDNWTTSSFLAS